MASKVKAKTPKATRRGRTSTSRLSTKNQLTLPVDIVREADLKTGDLVSFEIKAGEIVIKVARNSDHPLAGLIGAGGNAYKGFDLKTERGQMWPR
jgi:hypothetical protein